MAVLKIKLAGSGKDGDAYRVNVPTYSLIHHNVTQGWALISVADAVHGLTADDLAHEAVEETSEGSYYPELCEQCIDKMHAHFDERYVEHEGEFRVERA